MCSEIWAALSKLLFLHAPAEDRDSRGKTGWTKLGKKQTLELYTNQAPSFL